MTCKCSPAVPCSMALLTTFSCTFAQQNARVERDSVSTRILRSKRPDSRMGFQAIVLLIIVAPSALGATYASSGGTGVCATDGSSYSYMETVSSTTRTIVANVCPNHPYYPVSPQAQRLS